MTPEQHQYIEYMEVERASIDDLNLLGRQGWRPASLRWQEGYYDRIMPDEREGWTGLLYREVTP